MPGDSHALQWRDIGAGEGFLGFSEGVGFDGGKVIAKNVYWGPVETSEASPISTDRISSPDER